MEQQPALGFAELLRRLRGEAKLTQEELAQAAGISTRSVSDLERGINRTARKDTALLLADALNLAEPARALFIAAARGRTPAEDVLAAMRAGTRQASAAAPRLDPGPAQPWLVPAQLPPDVAGFADRERELEQLESLAVARAEPHRSGTQGTRGDRAEHAVRARTGFLLYHCYVVPLHEG
jgi:transcriptional regulator with XRE-family HTH domain